MLLHIDSAITGDASVTRRLSAAVVDHFRQAEPGLAVTYRDLAADPLPVFSGDHLRRIADPLPVPATRLEDVVVEEFMAADTIVIGAPMYNFSIPGQLKNWVDHLSKPGVTFAPTPTGPAGLVRGKRVVIVSGRGGRYGPGLPTAAAEHQESYLQAVLKLFGVTEIEVVRAEGVKISPAFAQQAIDQALATVDALAA